MFQLPKPFHLSWVKQALRWVLLLQIASCSCNQATIPPTSAISMQIPTTKLVGEAKTIQVQFNIGDTTLLDGWQLRITVIKQEAMGEKEVVAASQITYQDATGAKQSFAHMYTGDLNQLIDASEFKAGKSPQVNFNLIPADQVVKLQLQFELLQSKGNNQVDIVQSIMVVWMIKEIVFNVVTDEQGTFLTLQSLQEDITDLRQTTVNIASAGDNVFFSVDGKKMSVANLAQLLPHQQVLRKGQESPRIPIVVDPAQATAEGGPLDPTIFNVWASHAQTTSQGTSLKMTPPDYPEIVQKKIEQLEELRKEEKVHGDKLEDLQDEKDELKKRRRKVREKLRKEIKQFQKIQKQAIKALKEQRDQDLKSKNEAEKQTILEKYKQKKQAILALDNQVMSERLAYAKGLWNGYAHNTFGISLKDAKNESFYKGQQAGLKISYGGAGLESAIGAALLSGGIFTILFTAGISLPFSIAVIVVGAILLIHAVYAGARAQNNYAQKQVSKKHHSEG